MIVYYKYNILFKSLSNTNLTHSKSIKKKLSKNINYRFIFHKYINTILLALYCSNYFT